MIEPQDARANQSLFVRRALSLAERPSVSVDVRRVGQVTSADLEGRTVFILNEAQPPAGELGQRLRTAVANGASAMATVVYICPDAEDRLEPAREALDATAALCALSAWNGMLVARLLSRDAQALRVALSRLISHLRAAPMPRVWQC